MRTTGFMTNYERLKLKTDSAISPRFYILIKLHKGGAPGRPIVSTINTVGSNLSKYLCKMLNNLSIWSCQIQYWQLQGPKKDP
jgi:hypothetical protein